MTPKFLYRAIGWSASNHLLKAIAFTRADAIARLAKSGGVAIPHPKQALGIWRRGTLIERLERGRDFQATNDLPMFVMPEGLCRPKT
jgi:mannitol/fructose-specific phosphotransferase system IIA component (Ntr-type)